MKNKILALVALVAICSTQAVHAADRRSTCSDNAAIACSVMAVAAIPISLMMTISLNGRPSQLQILSEAATNIADKAIAAWAAGNAVDYERLRALEAEVRDYEAFVAGGYCMTAEEKEALEAEASRYCPKASPSATAPLLMVRLLGNRLMSSNKLKGAAELLQAKSTKQKQGNSALTAAARAPQH